ncbi:MAG: hypothetical protein Q9207_005176 [Kuettlingeria erythrocarpa]
MLLLEILGFAAFAFIPLSAGQSFGQAFTQQSGRTRLLGSSFGTLGINASFDYVIVGGGTAGLTVARRLAQNPQLSVAVVEGGSFYEIDNGNYSQIPGYATRFSSADPASIQPLVDWGIVTLPETVRSQVARVFGSAVPNTDTEQQLNNRRIHYTQGKCLGGRSVILYPLLFPTQAEESDSSGRNYLAYHRGTRGSYQQWANQIGDQSYTFDKLLPYFQRSVRFSPPDYVKRGAESSVLYDQDAFSSAGGPLHVSYRNFYQPFSAFIKQGLQKLGLKNIAGLNSGSLLGFSEPTVTVDPKAAIRSSSETSFLQEAIATSTLQVYQNSLAKRIVFNDAKDAQAVIIETAGVEYKLLAKKEVILSAGVFRSPQMLMVSGVGPSSTLGRLKVPVVSALEGVGQGMQLLVNPAVAAKATEDYLETQTGPLSSAGSNWVGWEKVPRPLRDGLSKAAISDLSAFAEDWPELELLPIAAATVPVTDADNYATVSIALLTTTSRGNVTIASTDTNDNPLVSTNWLLTSTDQELAVAGFKRARQIAAATGITVGPEVFPGPQIQTDEQILQFLRGTVGPIHHASATCVSQGFAAGQP